MVQEERCPFSWFCSESLQMSSSPESSAFCDPTHICTSLTKFNATYCTVIFSWLTVFYCAALQEELTLQPAQLHYWQLFLDHHFPCQLGQELAINSWNCCL